MLKTRKQHRYIITHRNDSVATKHWRYIHRTQVRTSFLPSQKLSHAKPCLKALLNREYVEYLTKFEKVVCESHSKLMVWGGRFGTVELWSTWNVHQHYTWLNFRHRVYSLMQVWKTVRRGCAEVLVKSHKFIIWRLQKASRSCNLRIIFLNIETKNFVQHRIYECRHSTETKQTKE